MEYMASASNEDGVIDKENLTYSFNGVDFNSDGVVSVDEYYLGTSPQWEEVCSDKFVIQYIGEPEEGKTYYYQSEPTLAPTRKKSLFNELVKKQK